MTRQHIQPLTRWAYISAKAMGIGSPLTGARICLLNSTVPQASTAPASGERSTRNRPTALLLSRA